MFLYVEQDVNLEWYGNHAQVFKKFKNIEIKL